MHHANPHQQLFNTQCHGLSAVWARAAVQEARDSRAGLPTRPADARWKGRAALAVACAAGVLVMWLIVSPSDFAASAGSTHPTWAGSSVPAVAEAAS